MWFMRRQRRKRRKRGKRGASSPFFFPPPLVLPPIPFPMAPFPWERGNSFSHEERLLFLLKGSGDGGKRSGTKEKPVRIAGLHRIRRSSVTVSEELSDHCRREGLAEGRCVCGYGQDIIENPAAGRQEFFAEFWWEITERNPDLLLEDHSVDCFAVSWFVGWWRRQQNSQYPVDCRWCFEILLHRKTPPYVSGGGERNQQINALPTPGAG